MYQFENSIFINRYPQEVFAFVTDLNNYAKWQGGKETFQWITEEPHGVGSRYTVQRALLGRQIEGEIEIAGWEEPNQYTIRISSGPLTTVYTREFRDQGKGTLLTQVGQLEISGIFRVMEGLLGRYTERVFTSAYSDLKLIMEAVQENKS